MRTGFGVLLLLGFLVLSIQAQDLSTNVYPTEEELEQALANHEIDAAQFIELRELIRFGIDSSHTYLFDVIPNLTYSSRYYGYQSSLETIQAEPFLVASDQNRFPYVRLKFSYARRLENDSSYRHIESMHTQITERVSSDIRLAKEYTTETRMLGRTITYQDKQGAFRKLIIGNYYARFGLGGVIGYRGRILNTEDSFTEETLLFPDNTGYNGFFVDSRIDGRKAIGLLSVQRDSSHSLVTGGALIGFSANPHVPELIVSVTSIRNRISNTLRAIATGSLFLNQVYASGTVSTEVIAQGEEQLYPGGALVLGTHRSHDIAIAYRGWLYSDDFVDLTSGGYSGRVRRNNEIEQTALLFSDRHRGQEGFAIRTSAGLGHGRRFLANATVASVNSDTTDIQLLLGITSPVSKNMDVRLDYLATDRVRNTTINTISETIHQLRLETTFRLGRFASRQYIATRWNDNAGQLGIFVNPRYTLTDNAEIEAWFSGRGAALDDADSGYSYMYIRTVHQLFTNSLFSLKFSHRFKQESGTENQSTITGNLELIW